MSEKIAYMNNEVVIKSQIKNKIEIYSSLISM